MIAILLVGLVTWEALTPKRDWHDAPIHLFPLRLHLRVGTVGTDTAMHVAGTALLVLLLHLLLPVQPTKRASLELVGGVLGWLFLVELIQGLLPYRNFQLTDLLANLTGSALAFGIVVAFRFARRKKQAT